jgi:glyoxylase-like metal-dependent hydrolase (beta-lactamase superfamily II)
MGMEVDDLSHLLLTHAHLPHAGAAEALRKMGVEVLCTSSAAEAIHSGGLGTAAYHYRKTFPVCREATELEGGDTVEAGRVTLTAVELPGHSPGHAGFWLQASNRLMLFCGDAVRSPDLQTYRDRPGYDPDLYLQSLKKLLDRPPEVLYPGHGPFCLSHGESWVQAELTKVLRDKRSPSGA